MIAALRSLPRTVWLIEGIAEVTASLLKLISGVIFDRTRRAKSFILFGDGPAGLTRPMIAFITA